MRYNEKVLGQLAQKKADLEGRLNYKNPSGSFRDSGYKDRWFKLYANFLFYFRLNELGNIEDEPAGVIVLEHCTVEYEIYSEMPFAFSLRFNGEHDKKHLFSAATENQVFQWVSKLQKASYDFWRSQLMMLQNKLHAVTGKDPLQVMPHNKGLVRSMTPLLKKSPKPQHNQGISQKSSTFHSHLGGLGSSPTNHHRPHTDNSESTVKIGNLIDL